jgi:hypothetical protein
LQLHQPIARNPARVYDPAGNSHIGIVHAGAPIHGIASDGANRTPIEETIDQDYIGRRVLVPVASAAPLSVCGDGDDPDPEPQPTRGTLVLTLNGVNGNADVAARNAEGH